MPVLCLCRTLSPVWNESFKVDVSSRVAANFRVEVFDWDQIGTATSLGSGVIDLSNVEPFESLAMTIPLVTPKHGQKGSVRIQVVFQPAIIIKSRKVIETFRVAPASCV